MSKPTTQQSSFDKNILAALDWLVHSEGPHGGSRAYYHAIKGWSASYPETTGYIIPTLLRASKRTGNDTYRAAALRMGEWLLTLQDKQGWFPGGLYTPGKPGSASVFNSAQIVFGLVALHQQTEDERYKLAGTRTVEWLGSVQDASGAWNVGAYLEGHSPSYYAHVCWPVALYAKTYDSDKARNIALKGIEHIDSHRLPDGTYSKWAFAPGKPAPTHTMAYTMQGAIETAILLDRWDAFAEHAAESMTMLLKRYELRKILAGAYGQGWKEVSWYKCLTGHCQLASAWLRLFERTGDPRYLNVACKAVEEVAALQNITTTNPSKRGAISGSSPIWGRYMFLRYPNWAAKFFVDAATDLQDNLERISKPAD